LTPYFGNSCPAEPLVLHLKPHSPRTTFLYPIGFSCMCPESDAVALGLDGGAWSYL